MAEPQGVPQYVRIERLQEMLRERDRLWDGVSESPEEVLQELREAQATIQRVRELCESKGFRWRINDFGDYALTVRQVLAALDGTDG